MREINSIRLDRSLLELPTFTECEVSCSTPHMHVVIYKRGEVKSLQSTISRKYLRCRNSAAFHFHEKMERMAGGVYTAYPWPSNIQFVPSASVVSFPAYLPFSSCSPRRRPHRHCCLNMGHHAGPKYIVLVNIQISSQRPISFEQRTCFANSTALSHLSLESETLRFAPPPGSPLAPSPVLRCALSRLSRETGRATCR